MYDLAMKLMEQGIYAVPYGYDRHKAPKIPYAHWREVWPLSTPHKTEYSEIWRKYNDCGMLMLCNDLCVIDIDVKNALSHQDLINEFEVYMAMEHPDILDKLYIEDTPSGGRHYVYKPWKNQRSFTLARRNSTPEEIAAGEPKFKTLVDFLADEKLCRIAPSQGYEVVHGDILNLPVLTEDEHNAIIVAAMQLNSYVEEVVTYGGHPAVPLGSAERPGDVYNQQVSGADIISLVERHGYRVLARTGCMVKLNRPGARTRGVDATINLEQRWFYGFSSSLPFANDKAISFFSLYTQLEHNGDFKASARAVAEMYHLDRKPANQPLTLSNFELSGNSGQLDEKKTPESAPSIWSLLEKNKFSFTKTVKEQWLLYHKDPYDEYASPIPVGGQGMIGVVSGESKSFKSQLIGAIESTALGRPHQTGFQMYLPEDRPEILHIDTEQSGIYAQWSVKCINFQADIGCDLPHYHAFFFREYSAAQRLKYLQALVDENPRIGVVVIDGLLDLVRNFNDEKEAADVLQYLMTMADRGIMILCVIHTGESKGSAGKPLGHLGSTVMRKADFILRCTVDNPEEENVRLRRVTVRNPISRGVPMRSFCVMSYEKMLYIMGTDVPEHYRKWYAKETGFELEPPKAAADRQLQELAKLMGDAQMKVERVEPDVFEMLPATNIDVGGKNFVLETYDNYSGELKLSGKAAAIAVEKDYELDEDFAGLLGLSDEEAAPKPNTS